MRFFLAWCVCLCLAACSSVGSSGRPARAEPPFALGLDQPEVYGPRLRNKRVGLMVNPGSVDSRGVHAIDKLLAEEATYGFKLTALFSVEHGLRGQAEAGFGDESHVDPRTQLPIISLYGRDADGRSRAHPTAEQLAGVDVLVYDLQDVGVRFFTYTLSMHWAMEGVQAQGKEFMVLDRPNPNGDQVYGPLLERENVSGIGIHPVPMVHGLTSAEFAAMTVGQGWLNGVDHGNDAWDHFGDKRWQLPAAQLHLVPMRGYRHSMPYALPVRPSPNLSTPMAVRMYPSLGLFEATSVNMGRGSAHPHEQLGFPDPAFFVNAQYTVDINQAGFGWPQAGKTVWGESFQRARTGIEAQARTASIRPFVSWWFRMQAAGYAGAVDNAAEAQYLNHADRAFVIRPLWLAKLVGTRSFLAQLKQASQEHRSVDDTVAAIERSWQPGLVAYREMRARYLLYP